MKIHKPYLIIIPWILAIATITGYYFYYQNLAAKILGEIGKSNSISLSNSKISGFPYRFTLIGENFSMPFGKCALLADEISLSASALEPNLWVLEGMKNPKFQTSNGNLEIKPNAFQASIRISKNEQMPILERVSIIAQKIEVLQGEIKISNFNNSDFQLLFDKKQNIYGLSFGAENIGVTYDSEYFEVLKKLIIRGPIDKPKAFSQGINNWRSQGGKFQIKYFEAIDTQGKKREISDFENEKFVENIGVLANLALGQNCFEIDL